jgi:hypothetical protein
MRRTGEGRAPVERRDEPRLGHVGDIENDEAAVPIADIEPVALAQRMMAAVRRALPARLFAAGGPLSGHPPAADLARVRWLAEVEDHHDVAAIARNRGRDISVAPVEIEAMDAHAIGLPAGDLARVLRPGHVMDAEPAAKIVGRRIVVSAVALAIDQHQPIVHAHLVRMGAGWHLEPRHEPGMRGVSDIDDRSAGGRTHVADERGRAGNDDLAAARAIEISDLTQALAGAHGRLVPMRRHHVTIVAAAEVLLSPGAPAGIRIAAAGEGGHAS